MKSLIKDYSGLIVLFVILTALTLWVHFFVAEMVNRQPQTMSEENHPDYYVFNFTSTGMDKSGKLYDLIADRMVHYPLDGKALLDKPQVVKYNDDDSVINLYADSGWLYNNGETIRLSENVRIVQGESEDLEGGGSALTDKLIVHLKDD